MTALRGEPEHYNEAILEACLQNRQYDPQLEGGRAPYLMALVDKADLAQRLFQDLLTKLPGTDNYRDRNQMVDILAIYAGRGEEEAWDLLTTIAEGGDENAQNELAVLSERGLIWVRDHILPTIPPEDLWRLSGWLPDGEEDDRTPTQKELRSLSNEFKLQQKSHRASYEQTPSPAEFLARLGHEPLSWQASFAFAKEASEAEMIEVANFLLQATDRRALRTLDRVFGRRPYPLPLETLFPHVDHDNRGHYVRTILGRVDLPQIRDFGLDRLQRIPMPLGALAILEKSAVNSDWSPILQAVNRFQTQDPYDLHDVATDLVALLRSHPTSEWQPLAEWVYENSPCSYCRASAVRWMAETGTIPESIRREGIHDAESEIRDLIEKGSGE
jgi:hypothetical protein